MTNIPADKQDGTPQANDHADHHNQLAEAVNALETVVGEGGIPDPTEAQVGDVLVKKSDEDNDVEWQTMREVPEGSSGRVGEVVTKQGVGSFAYGWEKDVSSVGWGTITKEWFFAGTSLPGNASSRPEGTVFVIYEGN